MEFQNHLLFWCRWILGDGFFGNDSYRSKMEPFIKVLCGSLDRTKENCRKQKLVNQIVWLETGALVFIGRDNLVSILADLLCTVYCWYWVYRRKNRGTGGTCAPRFCNKQKSALFMFRNCPFSLIKKVPLKYRAPPQVWGAASYVPDWVRATRKDMDFQIFITKGLWTRANHSINLVHFLINL